MGKDNSIWKSFGLENCFVPMLQRGDAHDIPVAFEI